jgi:hypothetical protein
MSLCNPRVGDMFSYLSFAGKWLDMVIIEVEPSKGKCRWMSLDPDDPTSMLSHVTHLSAILDDSKYFREIFVEDPSSNLPRVSPTHGDP